MARCDYHGCAICDGKSFYNANMSLDDEGGYWGCEVVALCSRCAKTHEIVVRLKQPEPEAESHEPAGSRDRDEWRHEAAGQQRLK